MKMIFLIPLSVLLLTVHGYCQTAKSEQNNTRINTITGRGNAPDTIIEKKTELSFNKIYPTNYKPDDSIVQVLRPHLVAQIVAPNDHSNSVYIDHVRNAKEKLPEAKSALLQQIKTSSSFKEYMRKFNINDDSDINSVSYLHICMYYITPNIVFYKRGETVAKYYNLTTGGIQYLMFKNNKPIGLLGFYNGKSTVTQLPNALAESYAQIKRMGKTPIGLSQSISTTDPKKMIGGMNAFGYVDHGHLVFSFYEEGLLKQVGYGVNNTTFQKIYTLEIAESIVSRGIGSSAIQQWVESAVNYIKKYPSEN